MKDYQHAVAQILNRNLNEKRICLAEIHRHLAAPPLFQGYRKILYLMLGYLKPKYQLI